MIPLCTKRTSWHILCDINSHLHRHTNYFDCVGRGMEHILVALLTKSLLFCDYEISDIFIFNLWVWYSFFLTCKLEVVQYCLKKLHECKKIIVLHIVINVIRFFSNSNGGKILIEVYLFFLQFQLWFYIQRKWFYLSARLSY